MPRCAHSRVSNINFDIKSNCGGGLYEYAIKICQGRQSSCPLAKLKVLPGSLTALCGIMHLKPTARCQISILIFEILNKYAQKYVKDGKVLAGSLTYLSNAKYQYQRQSSCPLLAKLKVLPGSLTDLSA